MHVGPGMTSLVRRAHCAAQQTDVVCAVCWAPGGLAQ